MKIKFEKIGELQMRPDCYGGKNFDEHIPQWWGYFEGDKQDDTTKKPFALDPKDHPPGTKITIEEPVCPKCEEIYTNCMVRGYDSPDECDFDWKGWVEEQFS